jgi:hypothetical protein
MYVLPQSAGKKKGFDDFTTVNLIIFFLSGAGAYSICNRAMVREEGKGIIHEVENRLRMSRIQ